jgi:hypothetical protein
VASVVEASKVDWVAIAGRGNGIMAIRGSCEGKGAFRNSEGLAQGVKAVFRRASRGGIGLLGEKKVVVMSKRV